MLKEIHIVLSSSNEFIEHCATTIASILYNLSQKYYPHFYILSYDLTDKNKKKLEKLNKIKKCIIEYPSFDEKLLNMFDGIKIPSHVTKMTYARILIPDILPKVNRAIFVDSDMIVRTDISKLYEIDITNYYFAMVEDACGKINAKRLWNNSNLLYFNCGLMLINSEKLRNDDYLKIIAEQIKINKSKYIICDQDVLNDTFVGKILPLYISWNFHHEKFFNLKWFIPADVNNYYDIQKNPCIIHCTGAEKPWLLAISHKYKNEYYKYNKLTAFYNIVKFQKFTINNIKYESLSIYEHLIYFKKSDKVKKDIKFLGVPLNYISKFVSIYQGKDVYNLKFLKLSLVKKKDSLTKQYIKILGLPIYYHKLKPKKISNEELYNHINSMYIKLSELYYQMSYISMKIHEHHSHVLPPYKNIYSDKQVVICGAGPTLNFYNPIKNAIHIGLNRVYEKNQLKLDYIFAWDFANLSKDDPLYYKKIQKHPAKKIFGLFMNDQLSQINKEMAQKLDALTLYSSQRLGLLENAIDPNIHYDIESYPLMDFGSVAFGAFHFSLYTGAKKIYLVGIDNSLGGYFDKNHHQRFLQTDEIYKGWLKVKQFMKIYYPDVELISVNPVGLRGLFKDVFTKKYIEAHPELASQHIEILN